MQVQFAIPNFFRASRKTTGSTPATSQPAVTPAMSSTSSSAAGGSRASHLGGNPLFADGANYDEFQLNLQNLDFAKAQFGLDADFVSLVKSEQGGARYSVVYHSDGGGLHVDAYRTAAPAGRGSVFSAYSVKDASFDPSKAYKNELMTKLADDRWFGTVIPSRRLAVPDCADAALKQYLASNGYEAKENVPFSSLEYSPEFKKFFGIADGLGLEMHELGKKSFGEKFKIFYQLCKESPEYRVFKLADVLNEVGSAMLLGVITPELWKQGTAYGIASTISSIGNIGGPAVGIVGESFLGSVVDNAVNSDHPIDNLKKITLATGSLYAVKIGATFGMHPAVIGLLGNSPGLAFTALYAGSTVLGAVCGVVNAKADIAIHDQLINKARDLKEADYAKNFYQILGVEASLSRALYLGSYSATVAALSAFPGASVMLAGVGGVLWAASNLVWPLYHEKPEVKTTIEATGFVHQGDRYVFDSGWEVSLQGGQGRIVQEDGSHFSVSMDDGELRVKNDSGHSVDVTHKRRLKDYLPRLLKPKVLGEKEHWELDNGNQKVVVSRYGNKGFGVETMGPDEFVVKRGS